MNSIKIRKEMFDYIVEKPDVDIVYLTNGKYWICKKNNSITDLNNGFYRLNLEKKEVK